MQFTMTLEAIKAYPELKFGFFLVHPILQYGSDDEAKVAEEHITSRVRERFKTLAGLESDPMWSHYDSFYRGMALNPKRCSTPLMQAARFLKGPYRSKGWLIDTVMDIEYVSTVSIQIYDADRCGSDCLIDIAQDAIPLIDMHGKDGTCKRGELILGSERGLLHCPSVGNARDFSLSETTERALVRLMGIPGLSDADWQSTVAEVEKRLSPKAIAILAQGCMSAELNPRSAQA